jgi:hypothetical protein
MNQQHQYGRQQESGPSKGSCPSHRPVLALMRGRAQRSLVTLEIGDDGFLNHQVSRKAVTLTRCFELPASICCQYRVEKPNDCLSSRL